MCGDQRSDREDAVDVVRFGTSDNPRHRTVPAGSGAAVVAAHDDGRRTALATAKVSAVISVVVFGAFGAVVLGHPAGALFAVPALVPGGAVGVADRFDQRSAELVAEGIDPDRARRRYDVDGSVTD